MSKFKDFDAVWAERARSAQPPTVKVFGETYTLPPSMPAGIVFGSIRLMRAGGAEAVVNAEVIEQMIVGLFGEEALSAWLRKGVTVEQLEEIGKFAMESYGAGEAPAPETGQPTPTTES